MESSRLATKTDARIVADLVNRHESAVDLKATVTSEQSAISILSGYVDPFPAVLYFIDDVLVAIITLHPDALRKTLFSDIYAQPGLNQYPELIAQMMALAKKDFPDYEIQPGSSSLDQEMIQAFMTAGFEILRTFWNMRGSLESIVELELPVGFRFQRAQLESEEDLQNWHLVHQDSFQNHFNFKPRGFESWRTILLADEEVAKHDCFLLFEGEQPVGFVSCTDEFADEARGYISGLGVCYSHQGRGLGELLIRKGMVQSRENGFTSIELGVDSGNESGALKLYQKVGLAVESSLVRMSRKS